MPRMSIKATGRNAIDLLEASLEYRIDILIKSHSLFHFIYTTPFNFKHSPRNIMTAGGAAKIIESGRVHT